jgi:hypothetical protein
MKMDTRKVIWTKKEDELPAVEVVDAKALRLLRSVQETRKADEMHRMESLR